MDVDVLDPLSTSMCSIMHTPSGKIGHKRKRKRLRNLVDESSGQKKTKSKFLTIALVLALITLAVIFSTSSIGNNFRNAYREQYNLIVHGTEEYCNFDMNTTRLFKEIGKNLLNQEIALKELEDAFRSESNYKGVAISGPTGVGKTFFTELLTEHFPWQENVQTYVWSTYETESDKLMTIDSFLDNMSKCGLNLIVIDSLHLKDHKVVQEYSEKAKSAVKKGERLLVLFVFNIPTYSTEQKNNYHKDVQFVQNLKGLEAINFKKFNRTDLEKCVKDESGKLILSLKKEQLNEIVQSIDVQSAGCKTVRSKLLPLTKL